jgi:hypothetical protein
MCANHFELPLLVTGHELFSLQTGDLMGNLVTSAAEVPGLVFSLFMIHYCSRKLAFAIPMGAIPVVLIPLMAGELH